MNKTIVIASGYFNPLHKGHVEYIYEAMKLGSNLAVIVNNDKQVLLKGSKPFMDMNERMNIVKAMKYVDYVIPSIDEDRSVSQTITKIITMYRTIFGPETKFVFAKGGDRTKRNIPERKVCDQFGIPIIDKLGKKIQSSSELLNMLEKLDK